MREPAAEQLLDRYASGGVVDAVKEFVCLRAAGFEPVGQVMGASVHVLTLKAMTRRRPTPPLRGYAAHTVL